MAIESLIVSNVNTLIIPVIVSSFDNDPTPSEDVLLLENLSKLLLEDRSSILLEK
jgi:hypothetical protein